MSSDICIMMRSMACSLGLTPDIAAGLDRRNTKQAAFNRDTLERRPTALSLNHSFHMIWLLPCR